MKSKFTFNLKKQIAVALFCAIAYICVYLFRFNVGFLTFDLKDTVITLGAMYFGPVSGIVISLIVSLIEMITVSGTGIYGFIMNFLSSAVFAATAAFIYKRRHTVAGAVISLLAACATMTGVMLVANLIITPFYMHVTTADVVAMIPKLLLPFNLTKTLINTALVLVIYKPVSNVLKRSGIINKTGHTEKVADRTPEQKTEAIKHTLYMLLVAEIIIIIGICLFVFLLDGNISFNK